MLVNYDSMGYFPVRYDSRVVIYDRKMFIRLATDRGFTIVNYDTSNVMSVKLPIPSKTLRVVTYNF